jgi:hypothetical protein
VQKGELRRRKKHLPEAHAWKACFVVRGGESIVGEGRRERGEESKSREWRVESGELSAVLLQLLPLLE